MRAVFGRTFVGIATAGEPTAELAVRDVRILDNGILLLTFSTDASCKLNDAFF